MLFVLLLVCLFLLSVSFTAQAEEEAFAVNWNHRSFICTASGKITCPVGMYYSIYEIDSQRGLYCALDDETDVYCVVDAYGNKLTDSHYASIHDSDSLGEDYISVERSGGIGVWTKELNVVIPWQKMYTDIVGAGDGTFLAIKKDPIDGEKDCLCQIDKNGQETVTGIHGRWGLSSFSEGFIDFMETDTGCYGYLNAKGEWAFPMRYQSASRFHNGCAQVSLEGGFGLIDRNGKWLLYPRYAWIERNEGRSSLAVAQENRKRAVLLDTATMERKRTFTDDSVSFRADYNTDVATIWLSKETLLVDKNGETLFHANKDASFFTSEGMSDLVIKKEGKKGDCNTQLFTMQGKARTEKYQSMSFLTSINSVRFFEVEEFETLTMESVYFNETIVYENPDTVRYSVIDEFGNEVLPMGDYSIEVVKKGLLLIRSKTQCNLFDLAQRKFIEIG